MEGEDDIEKRQAERAEKLKITKAKRDVAVEEHEHVTNLKRGISNHRGLGDIERQTARDAKKDISKVEKKLKRKADQYENKIEAMQAEDKADDYKVALARSNQRAVETFSSFDTKDGDEGTASVTTEATEDPWSNENL